MPSIKRSCKDNADVANPIHAGTGNKYQKETDYTGLGAFPLQLNRSYNSAGNPAAGMFGPLWRSTYDRAVRFDNANPSIVGASVYRPDGQMYVFTYQYGYYSWTDLDVVHRLANTYDTSGVQTGYKYTSEAIETELYDLNGKLLSITDRVGLIQTLTYSDANTPTFIAPRPGLLIQVTDPFGPQLNFTYDASGKVATMIDPTGQPYLYVYDGGGRLNAVTYPDTTPTITTDNSKRIYHYENTSFPNALTGISDENGVRFATWGYDGAGRASSSEHAGGADKTTIGYNANGTSTVTDYKDSTTTPNTSRTYTFQNLLGATKTTSVTQPCASCGGASAAARTYDANGNVASKLDFNGNLTCSYYSSDNLEYIRAEGLSGTTCPTDLSTWTPTPNTAQRKISKFWNSTYRIPTDVYEPKRRTIYSISGCGANGVVCAKTVYETTDANGGAGYFPAYASPFNTRIWTYTYNAQGQVLTVDGPRTDVTDVTTYSYYTANTASYRIGDLATVTNALGHVTTISAYDGNGRPLSITDPNRLVTTLTYTPRGWLNTRTVGGSLTQFTYDNVGQLTKITQPDGSFIGYVYDPAHRLTDITNAAGDTIHYTLDLMGNRTQEQVKDGLGVVKQQKARVFDALSRLATELNAANQIIASYTYDNNGNIKTQTQKYDAVTTNDAVTSFDYDPLNRLTKITNALAGITQYNYDGVDHQLHGRRLGQSKATGLARYRHHQ